MLVERILSEAGSTAAAFEVKEVDVVAAPQVAVKYGVVATPAVAINGRLEFRRAPSEEALRTRLKAFGQSAATEWRDRHGH